MGRTSVAGPSTRPPLSGLPGKHFRFGLRIASAQCMQARLLSIAIHVSLIAALFLAPLLSPPVRKAAEPPSHPTIQLHLRPRLPETPAGGGDRSPIPATKGRLPRIARRYVPPVNNLDRAPVLSMPPSIDVSAVPLETASLTQYGDPFARPGPPSLGTGLNGVGGTGRGGIGDSDGPGRRGGGSGVMEGPLTGPVVLFQPDPEFSEEARKAKLQGQVVLEGEIGTDGKVHNVTVRTGLGLGLDEKALEAVTRWRFRPAHRAGKPVSMSAVIYINFRLL